jgi:hypothetical protein
MRQFMKVASPKVKEEITTTKGLSKRERLLINADGLAISWPIPVISEFGHAPLEQLSSGGLMQ